MRDFAVVMIVLGSVPISLVRPYVGILMWFWLSLMNPHRMSWGYAQQMHPTLIVGSVTLLSWLLSREPKRIPTGPLTWMLLAFTLWLSMSVPFAQMQAEAIEKWQEIIKILGMTFIAASLILSRERLRALVWVIVVSLGFYGVKGGIFTILTGGNYHVWGPPGTFIEDNNQLAVALIMTMPLMYFLRTESANPWVKRALLGAMVLMTFSILGSQSRGALLGLLPAVAFLWAKSRSRLVTGLVILVCAAAALSVMPETWWARMHTIDTYQTDGSAQGRLWAWTFAIRLAADYPMFGGGLEVFDNKALYTHYIPEAAAQSGTSLEGLGQNFHSIYFQMLGETGIPGLVLFIALILVSLLTARSIIRRTRNRPERAWAASLASMIQVSILGYAVSGAFQNLGFYDLFYALIAILIALREVVSREETRSFAQERAETVPRFGEIEAQAPG